MVGVQALLPADIERDIGVTDGDLEGGEIAPDQILGFRPLQYWQDARTVVAGLYLGGPSAEPSPFLSGVSGDHAALALLADLGGARP